MPKFFPMRYRQALPLLLLTCLPLFAVAEPALQVSRADYALRLQGFWLGQNIGNWTGLITEMDTVGSPETLPFYTDDDWGTRDRRSLWGEFVPHAKRIAFYFEPLGTPWGADDDTDLEYMYAFLLDQHATSRLSATQIRDGWLKHIYSETDAPLFKKFPDSKAAPENFLWVSNERARQLMADGMLPPQTSDAAHNAMNSMIDAQLTTEIFGLLSPGRPDVAEQLAYLPIRTTAQGEAEWIAQFYVAMHSFAIRADPNSPLSDQSLWLAEQASQRLPETSIAAKMYHFIKTYHTAHPDSWEAARDAIYVRYQIEGKDGYKYQEPFDALINFAASLISWFYGQGDIQRTLQIATLVGWDSDNPSATWGGLLGFLLGIEGVKAAFNQPAISTTYWIHRTRRNFPDNTPNEPGEDNFALMAARNIKTIDRIVVNELAGSIDHRANQWIIPLSQ